MIITSHVKRLQRRHYEMSCVLLSYGAYHIAQNINKEKFLKILFIKILLVENLCHHISGTFHSDVYWTNFLQCPK